MYDFKVVDIETIDVEDLVIDNEAENNIDVSNFTTKQLCDFWNSNSSKLLTEKVEIEILEKENKRKIMLTKKQLLPK